MQDREELRRAFEYTYAPLKRELLEKHGVQGQGVIDQFWETMFEVFGTGFGCGVIYAHRPKELQCMEVRRGARL